jgi:hypothetical protein
MYLEMCMQYAKAGAGAGTCAPQQNSLALSDRTPRTWSDASGFLTTTAATLPPGQHPIGTHPPNPSTHLSTAVPDYVDLTLRTRASYLTGARKLPSCTHIPINRSSGQHSS